MDMNSSIEYFKKKNITYRKCNDTFMKIFKNIYKMKKYVESFKKNKNNNNNDNIIYNLLIIYNKDTLEYHIYDKNYNKLYFKFKTIDMTKSKIISKIDNLNKYDFILNIKYTNIYDSILRQDYIPNNIFIKYIDIFTFYVKHLFNIKKKNIGFIILFRNSTNVYTTIMNKIINKNKFLIDKILSININQDGIDIQDSLKYIYNIN